MAKTATKVQKTVQVLHRYELKSNGTPNGIVVYEVRSSKGDTTYKTTVVHGHASSCTCPATKPCYHMTQLEAKEQARKAQQEAEARAAFVAAFDPCGLGM